MTVQVANLQARVACYYSPTYRVSVAWCTLTTYISTTYISTTYVSTTYVSEKRETSVRR